MKLIGKTDIGRNRAENQDTFRSGTLGEAGGWGVVCDGMGGAQNGKLASAVAADCIEEMIFQQMQGDEEYPPQQVLADSIRLANAEVYARSGEGDRLMGTTAVCALIWKGRLYLAHVGDSRAYLFENGVLMQLTRDHSMVQELVDQGALTSAEAAHHPERNVITRALGVEEEVEITQSDRPVKEGATVLLCSDGLNSVLNRQTLQQIFETTDFYDLPRELISQALEAGGNDNITALVMQPGKADVQDG
ncbi:MAG: Stp1/IreP family PP2C-type Ser/Thr phosphatase [Oscillospiraceae bacterium]